MSLIPNKFINIILCTAKRYPFTITRPAAYKALKEITPNEVPEALLKIEKRNKTKKKVVISKLQEVLKVRPFVASEILNNNKKLTEIQEISIGENYTLCLQNGIKHETILNHPEILAEVDVEKIEELKKMPYDINTTAVLLCLSSVKFKLLTQDDPKRIRGMSKILNVAENKMCVFFIKRPFLITLDFERFKNNVKMLLGYGITKEDIIKDLWVLKYSTDMIKQRFELAKENGIEVLKTWMVRAQPEIFDKYAKRRSDNKFILGNNSIAEYLSKRLECTEQIAKYLISKHPALESKSLMKMNEMIDFLYNHGFKPIHICRVPKILLHSVETTRNRISELEAQGMHIDSLYILTKSQKQYLQYYEALVKTNKNKMKTVKAD